MLEMPLYKRYLESKVREGEIPKHVALILDGNRRFAQKLGLDYLNAYRMGASRTEELLDWLLELGVDHVTLYAFSTENFSRPKEQVEAVFKVIEEKLRDLMERKEELRRNGVRFRIVGKRELLPNRIRELAEELETMTNDFGSKTLNLAVAYGGRAEIVDAVRKIAREVAEGKLGPEEIDENVIRSHLYAPDLPDPDLIIRTSGEERLSNFLLWQSAYSELYFCEVYLPELRKIDILRAIRDYQRRKRRFGG
ncbi:MAG: polyprenyl diphosphate synthase [Candidatus Korarchaeota archaeon]|nr:polyprenyl diphosphate synthase [Candidatus Korarchaeota archaeon]